MPPLLYQKKSGAVMHLHAPHAAMAAVVCVDTVHKVNASQEEAQVQLHIATRRLQLQVVA